MAVTAHRIRMSELRVIGREGNFIAFRCASLSDAVLDVELFGDGRSQHGLLEAARKGTLYFDELSDLPLGIQSRLLAWLEERFQP